jgi:hypothetical protein
MLSPRITSRSSRSPVPYHHETMLASSSLLSSSKSKQHANFCNDPTHNHNHNHDLEKIKLIVNYSENGGVKTRTTRLIENDTNNYMRREEKFDLRQLTSSSKICTPPRIIPSPPLSPPLINFHHHQLHHPSHHAQHRTQQMFKEFSNRGESYREAYSKRSRSRSRTPSSKKIFFYLF